MKWLDYGLQPFRLLLRLVAFIGVLGCCAVVATALDLIDWLANRAGSDRGRVASGLMVALCRLLGFRLESRGRPPEGPALYICNHISWTDIPVLLSSAPLRFLAKKEVGDWPFIGWLARQANTLFIARGRGQSGQVRQTIASALAEGESVLVFPEGTTSDGRQVLPFHGRLLAAALDAGVPIQPVTLSYRRDGQPDPVAPFIGDDSFHRHLLRLLRHKPVSVGVCFHPPFHLNGEDSLEEQVQRLQAQVAGALHRPAEAGAITRPGQPPVLPASPDAHRAHRARSTG